MLGNTAYHLAIARAPGGLGGLHWLLLHAAQGHRLCIKLHHEVEHRHASTGGNQNRIRGCTFPIGTEDPATQPQRLGQSKGDMEGLYEEIIE